MGQNYFNPKLISRKPIFRNIIAEERGDCKLSIRGMYGMLPKDRKEGELEEFWRNISNGKSPKVLPPPPPYTFSG